MKSALITGALLALAGAAPAQDKPIAFRGALLMPVAGDPITNGVLVVHRGRITALGTSNQVTVPAGAEIRDVTGRVIIPGLVDTHSHIGGGWAGDRSAPIQPDIRILDSVNVRDATFKKAQAGGITTVNIMPGSGHLISGQTLYVKLRNGRVVENFLIRGTNGRPAGGLKMANGTNSRREPPFPGSRGKSASLVREKFIAAQDYRDKVARAQGDPAKLPPRDLALETLVEVLEGKRIVHHHTHRHDDILTVLRLQQEFGFRVVLHHVSDAWKVVPEIAAAKVPCSVILLDSPGGKLEARDVDWRNVVDLEKAGVLTAVHTDDPVIDSRLFLRAAALGVRAGMTRPGALKALTLAGAEMLDLADRVGSLAPGKDADFVVLSGDPFSVYTRVLETWVEGDRVFNLAEPKDRIWANGGWGAGNPPDATLCCFGDN